MRRLVLAMALLGLAAIPAQAGPVCQLFQKAKQKVQERRENRRSQSMGQPRPALSGPAESGTVDDPQRFAMSAGLARRNVSTYVGNQCMK